MGVGGERDGAARRGGGLLWAWGWAFFWACWGWGRGACWGGGCGVDWAWVVGGWALGSVVAWFQGGQVDACH